MCVCPTCGDDHFISGLGMRQHHTKVHGERLPNNTCNYCGGDFYDDRSDRKYCHDCSSILEGCRPPPDHVEMDLEEWVALSSNQRYYLRYPDKEKKRKRDNKKRRKEWLDSLIDEKVCENCGFPDTRALEFHHTDETELGEYLREMAHNMRSKKVIKEELERGEILCANCHAIEHDPKGLNS